MLKQPAYYFESLLGINPPWIIKEIVFEEKKKTVQLFLDIPPEKSRSFFLTKSTPETTDGATDSGMQKRWFHTGIGCYSCIIVSKYVNQTPCISGISRDTLTQPHFLGSINRSYTHQLRQQVALSSVLGMSSETIARCYNIEQSLVDEILIDVEKTPENYRKATILPMETDSIWEKIITDKFQLKTQTLPLKLLLSKLKLANYDSQAKLSESIGELRKYFVAHANNLTAEYKQVCSLPNAMPSTTAEHQNNVLKLVLPALKNSIWLKLIAGKVDLESRNMPLNLFLVRSRHAFKNTSETNTRLAILNSLREFFRKNARSLKAELIVINKLMHTPEAEQFSLPNEQHQIWKKILKDDSLIPSSHMAYKLLLANLRSQLRLNPDPVVELSAARRIRDFINQNQRFMQNELRQVISISHAN